MPTATPVQEDEPKVSRPENPVCGDPTFPRGLTTDAGISLAPSDQDEPANEAEIIEHRLEDLPKELGVLLASVGVLGFILPGIAGTPALIAGGLVLWPKTFGKVEGWFHHRYPVAHRKSMQQVGRFLDDLQRRYPVNPVADSLSRGCTPKVDSTSLPPNPVEGGPHGRND